MYGYKHEACPFTIGNKGFVFFIVNYAQVQCTSQYIYLHV